MKKLLFFAYAFYPDASIGAVRISELVKRFSNSFECYVVVSNKTIKPHIPNVHFLYVDISKKAGGYSATNKIATKNTKKRSRFVFLKHMFREILRFKDDLHYYNYFKKNIYNKLPVFDYIFSTYNPLCNMLCGLFMKKKSKKTKFIADFRDPIVTPLNTFFFNVFLKRIQNFICKKADLIVPVSHGYQKSIVKKKYTSKSVVINNGFIDYTKNYLLPNKFSFFYCGYTYEKRRDFSSLFLTIRKLLDGKKISECDLEIRYAGNDSKAFEQFIKDYRLEPYYINLGVLTREQCFAEERSAFYQVVSTWNYKKYQGVIPGKFYEYIGSNRKILSICSGDLPGSEISEIINKLSLGYCLEPGSNIDDLANYLSRDYSLFKDGVYNFHPKCIHIYSYDTLAKRYISEINKIK